ncbi:MAG: hypothetical protein DMG59_04140 [Acidobacteria bacterium]|nr:MAG: hypothetical protein DMG59_04140 [Acidobacteriota bacterium]
MLWFLLASVLAPVIAKEPVYELSGQVETDAPASVSIYGATTPFSEATLSDHAGHFRFRKLMAGAYTLAVFVPGRGEARTTVEVGPGTADSARRVTVVLKLKDSDFVFSDLVRRHAVSTRELAIPDQAQREYERARKELARRDVEAAKAHLEKAVEIAPHFETAWNNLGTIAYQTQKFDRAEECFRRALREKPDAYEPLVNLGGVLVTVHKLDEAKEYNQHAVLRRPNDALANSQLGMTYFELGQLELGQKYLERARQIDPAHFSHPQLILAEIHMRKNEHGRAADDLEDFLAHHPDWPGAPQMRERIAKLRS